MSSNSFKVKKSLNLEPLPTQGLSEDGDIAVDSTLNKIQARVNGVTDSLVTESGTATLTNKTLTAPAITSPTGIVKGDVGLGNVDNTSDATKNAAAAVLTNKDIDGGTASDSLRITLPKNTKTNLDGLTRKEGTLVFDTVSKKPYFDNGTVLSLIGSGSGSGGVNYLTNPAAVDNTTGWNVYTDFLQASGADTLGDTVQFQKTSTGGAVLVGDLPENSRVRYKGLTPFGGMTLNTDYYLNGISGQGTNFTWNSFVASTPGGAAVNITTTAGTNLSGFYPYRPINGVTGNWGTSSVTWTRNTSSPIANLADFRFTKPASDCLGEGVSADFTIDPAYQGQQLAINYLMSVASGTFATGDVSVWIYDVTNKKMIQPSASQVVNTGIAGPVQPLVFQTASNSTSYRLIFHVSTVSALAYVLAFSNFSVGPQIVPVGAAVTDWKSYTPTLTASTTAPTIGNGSVSGRWRIVGDSMQIETMFFFGSTTTTGSGQYYMSVPSGYVMDSTKIVSTNFTNGTGFFYDNSSSANARSGAAQFDVANNRFGMYESELGLFGSGTTGIGGNGDQWGMSVTIPIVGWSSNTIVSDSAATRVVAAKAYPSSPQSGVNPNNSFVKILYNAIATDTHGAYDITQSRYTVKVPGAYTFNANVYIGGANTLANLYLLAVRKNGSSDFYGGGVFNTASGALALTITAQDFNAVAGDYYEVFLFGQGNNSVSTITTAGGPAMSFNISMIQGPAQIQAATKVTARYETSTAQSIPISTLTVVNFNTKTIDTAGSVTTGAGWRFTAPAPDDYAMTSTVQLQSVAGPGTIYLEIYKNNVLFSRSNHTVPSTTNTTYGVTISDIVPMLSGDYVDFRVFQNLGALTLSGVGSTNRVAISRAGGVF